MKKAFVATVLNEQDQAKLFIESLLSQSVKPDEIIIVDAGSNDDTVSIINNLFEKQRNKKYRVLTKRGNRSIGRNCGIKNANSEVIAVSDFGCVLDKNWFEKITKPLQNTKNDVVAGYYRPLTSNVFEKSLSTYTCFPEDKITKDFLPSSRSISFRKEVWKKVGGYPERLNTCEDLVFAVNLKKAGFNFVVEKKAIVLWSQKKNINEAFWQLYGYALGDGQARYIRSQTPLLYARYLFALVLLIMGYINLLFILFFLYLLWAIIKNYKYVREIQALIFLPLLQLIADIAVLLGTTIGLLRR